MPNNSDTGPFLFERGKTGCLLIHGFLGTPYEMRGLGEYLAEREITALGVRLAGHATSVEDMRRTNWRDWWGSVLEGYRQLRGMCDPVFVCGLSMGGAFVLHLAAHYPEIKGVVAIAPAVRLENPLLMLRNIPGVTQVLRDLNNPSDIHDPQAKAIHPSYNRIPTRCGISLLRLMYHVRDDLSEIRAPLLVMQARQDRAVPASNPPIVMAGVSSSDKELLWLERGGHVATVDYDKMIVYEKTYQFIQSHS